MDSRTFNFEFEHRGKTYPATCSVHTLETEPAQEMPYKYPMYRVAVDSGRLNPEVYLYYEVDQLGRRFFFYPLPEDQHKRIAFQKSILEALEKIK